MSDKEAADSQRAEAKVILLRQFGIAEGESNGVIERAVDCIIGAAIIETMLLINQGVAELKPKEPT